MMVLDVKQKIFKKINQFNFFDSSLAIVFFTRILLLGGN